MPTLDQIADALSYIAHEFDISNGFVDSEQWAEGLAFARIGWARGDRWAYDTAREVFPQLTENQWRIILARADHMRACDGYAGFDQPLITKDPS